MSIFKVENFHWGDGAFMPRVKQDPETNRQTGEDDQSESAAQSWEAWHGIEEASSISPEAVAGLGGMSVEKSRVVVPYAGTESVEQLPVHEAKDIIDPLANGV